MEYLYKEGLTQEEKGAHILDINVGLPEIDEPMLMEEAVTGIQAIIDLPLQIDTSDTEAMERGLRYYNGKPMLNSVNGKKESMEQVFPIAKNMVQFWCVSVLMKMGFLRQSKGGYKWRKRLSRRLRNMVFPRKI